MDLNLNLLILFTISCWGIWGIFEKKALEQSSDRDVVLMLFLLYLPAIPVVFALINIFVPGWHLSNEVIFWSGLAVFTYTIATVSYLTAMSYTEASYVLGITAGYPLIMQFLAVPILGESLVTNRLIGAALIGAGITIIGSSGHEEQSALTGRKRAIVFTCVILTIICWAIYGIFDKLAVLHAHPLEVYFAQCLWEIPLLGLVWLVFRMQGHQPSLRNPRSWKFCTLSALCLQLGGWTYLAALSISSASYVVAVTGCYPLLMYVLAIFMLKEKFNRGRLMGIGLVVIGGILVQLTQGAH